MSKVSITDQDQQQSVITVTVEQTDYIDQYQTELKKYRNQAHLKGFRRGKTPLGVIKKMYGKGILAELVNKLFQEKLFEYINNEKLNIIGQPILVEGQPLLEFDPKSPENFELQFEIGQTNDFEVEGLDSSEAFEFLKVTVPNEDVENDLQNARQRFGEMTFPEDDIKEIDTLTFNVQQMENGEVKADGITASFPMPVDKIADDEVKALIITKKKGDQLPLNIFELEDFANKDMPADERENFVKRYYLRLNEDELEQAIDPVFMATIEDVRRLIPAEMDEAFFKNMFGEETDIVDEEGAKETISAQYQAQFDDQAKTLLMDRVVGALIEKTDITLPEVFLKKWILVNNEKANPEKVEDEFDKYRHQVKRSLIQTKLADQYEIEVSEEEVAQQVVANLQQYAYYLQIQDQNQLIDMARRTMQNPEEYQRHHDEVVQAKLKEVLFEKVAIQENEIDKPAFEEALNAFREEQYERRYNFESPATTEEE